jgi:hypothetical protein
VHFQWVDATQGTPITNWTPNPDDGYAVLSLPFPFPYYDETLSAITVCSNGFLETSTITLYENLPLPCPDITNLIAPFWDDLALSVAGTVYQYSPPDLSSFVIAFIDVARYDPPQELQTFEVVLFPDGRIRFNYRAVNGNRVSNTVGIQGDEGNNEWYLQYVANGAPAQHVVRDSVSILFSAARHTHDVGVTDVRSPSPFMAPGTGQPVIAKAKNFGLQPESFNVRGHIVNPLMPFETAFTAAPTPVADLAPQETILVSLGNFTPTHEGTWRVTLFTELAGDEDRRNDTAARLTTNSTPFGTPLASWNLEAIGAGFDLAGITFCPDSNRFYLTSHDPNQVWSFAPQDPPGTLRPEAFQLLNLFGNDVIWGIAFDQTRHSFWVGHVEGSGNGTIVARYQTDGSFTGDTWNLWTIEANGWFAGLDHDPATDLFYCTKVGGSNSIYRLDVARRQLSRRIPGGPSSYRACSFLAANVPGIITGGWNQNQVLRSDTLGAVVASAILDSFADGDIYQPAHPHPDSLIYLMGTLSNGGNTVKKVSLGLTWRQLGITERSPFVARRSSLVLCPSPQANPIQIYLVRSRPGVVSLALFDLAGRRVWSDDAWAGRAGPQRLCVAEHIAPGTYFLQVYLENEQPEQKIVLVR